MPAVLQRLTFEKPIYELEDQIAGLESKHDKSEDVLNTLRNLRRELAELKSGSLAI